MIWIAHYSYVARSGSTLYESQRFASEDEALEWALERLRRIEAIEPGRTHTGFISTTDSYGREHAWRVHRASSGDTIGWVGVHPVEPMSEPCPVCGHAERSHNELGYCRARSKTRGECTCTGATGSAVASGARRGWIEDDA